jgi:hypothetical protein
MSWKARSVTERQPSPARQCGGEFAGHWRFYLQAPAVPRVVEAQFGARQQQAVAGEMFGEKTVVAPLP